MKIVIDAHIISSSSGRYVERLLEYLQRIDQQNEYVVLLPPEDADQWSPTAKNFTSQVFNYKRYSLGSQFRLARLLNRLNADVVHFTFQPDVYTPVVGILYRRAKVMTVHDLTQLRVRNRKRSRAVFEFLHWGFKILLRLNVWVMPKIIVPTQFVKNDIHQRLRYPLSRITVTLEAADAVKTSSIQPFANLQKSDFIMYVGTAQAHKNLPCLVRAFDILQKSYPGLVLAIVGKQTVFSDRLAGYITKKQVQNVMLTGFVPDEQLAWLYQHCRCYVFPSISEGFGLPGLEAMVYGAPVASSSASCLPEVYGDAANYFDPKSADDMARAISEILSDKKRRNNLIAKGHTQVKKYSWQRMAEQTLAVYQSFEK